jgi:plastocyanin
MRFQNAALAMLVLTALVGCQSGTAPYASGDPYGPIGGGAGTGGDSTSTPNAVTVGNIVFTSAHNGTAHPAVDTVVLGRLGRLGSTMTWTWTGTGQVTHSVQSVGATTFPSSGLLAGEGSSYAVKFTAPGTYRYDCAVHGAAMTGTIVVLPDE